MNKLIAVSIGDINGIGIKILIKEWKNNNINNFVLFTNLKLINKYISKNKINIKINDYSENYKFKKNELNIFNIKAKNNYFNSYNSLIETYKYVKKNKFIGIVTLPINKYLITKKINKNFVDQTEFFKKIDNKKINNMIFIYKNKFFTPLTTHIKLEKVSSEFANQKRIYNKIIILDKSLKKDFNILNPKFIIAGINPHSGEGGIIGKDEIINLIPIIKRLKKNKINITGPKSADTMVNKNNLKKFDCFIFGYHDQALIPFKLISNHSGINFTSNLNIIRTSPDHGTAYDLVKKGTFSSNGLLNSFKILRKIHKNRLSN